MTSPRRALIKHRNNKELVKFDPKRFRLNVAVLDFGIKEAKRIKEWPALKEAIEVKITEQVAFVAWWAAEVLPKGRPRKNVADHTTLNRGQDEKAFAASYF